MVEEPEQCEVLVSGDHRGRFGPNRVPCGQPASDLCASCHCFVCNAHKRYPAWGAHDWFECMVCARSNPGLESLDLPGEYDAED